MNTDIRLQLSIRYHPKTKKLRLKLGPDGLLGLIWLLMFAAESRPDGKLLNLEPEDLALAADYPGDPDEFVEVLVAIGFLDPIPGGWEIHDWAENNPWAAGARERSKKARKAAKVRWEQERPTTDNQGLKSKNDAPSIRPALPRASSSNAPSPSPSPSPSQEKEPKPIVELPAWVDAELWMDLEQHRREIGHKLTPTAARRILIKLRRFRDEYQVDPNDAISLTIERGWRGVIPEKIVEDREIHETRKGGRTNGSEGTSPSAPRTSSARRREAAERARERIRAVT